MGLEEQGSVPCTGQLCPVPATSSLPTFMSPPENQLQLVSGPAMDPALASQCPLAMSSQAVGPRALAGKSQLPRKAGVGEGHCLNFSTA